VAVGAGDDPAPFGRLKIGQAELVRFNGTHSRGSQFHTVLPGFLVVVITTVERIGSQFLWFQITFLCGFDGRDEGIGVAVMSRFDFHVGDQAKPLSFFLIGKGLLDLYLVPLTFMAAVSGIWVRRILKGV